MRVGPAWASVWAFWAEATAQIRGPHAGRRQPAVVPAAPGASLHRDQSAAPGGYREAGAAPRRHGRPSNRPTALRELCDGALGQS